MKADEITLDTALERYEFYSGKASDIARQLSLAGIAIIWLFSGGTDLRNVNIPNDLLRPGFLLAIALALDLGQYLYGAAAWSIYRRVKEKEGKPKTAKFSPPSKINWPTLACFWGKCGFVIVSYVLLAFALADRID